MRLWVVYVMAAPAMRGLTYFKIGITTDIAKRVCGVQTGCSLRITKIWTMATVRNGSAQSIESRMHQSLALYHSHGEWFAMSTDDPDHKAAMNEAMRIGRELANGGNGPAWNAVSVPDLKTAVRELAQEVALDGRKKAAELRRKAIVKMATEGRQIA